jgi:hypothetical protein
MRKAVTPRKRIFSFEGTNVTVVASILRKWDAIPPVEKHKLIDASYEEIIKRHETKGEKAMEEAWRKECARSESLEDMRKIPLVLVDRDQLDDNFVSFSFTKDPSKLRDAAEILERAAKHLRKRAESIESPMARGNEEGNEELRLILVRHWVSPNGVCLCWMSYPALANFFRLTCPGIGVHSVTALARECQRLGLPKLPHPVVEESQIHSSDKGVHLAG